MKKSLKGIGSKIALIASIAIIAGATYWLATYKAQTELYIDQLNTLKEEKSELNRQYIELLQANDELQRPGTVSKVLNTKNAIVTAYACPTEADKHTWTDAEIAMNCPSWNGQHGTTASGKKPNAKTTIACPRDMMGTTIEIEGIGSRTCQDTGGRIEGNKIDLFVKDKATAYKFGVQNKKITIANAH